MTLIQTPLGPVVGAEDAGIHRFLGIPYAQAPVGDLRFAAPVPIQPWSEPLDATAFGPVAPQGSAPGGESLWEPNEDANFLNLNVLTTDVTGSKPVMVWIHGGAYISGAGSQDMYDGNVYARRDVVFVSINYRLGFEGFGYLADGVNNRGLRDQITALAWVRDNIAAFGGDPNNITVFGESAGAGCIAALMASPAAQGLFQRAIAQSTCMGYYPSALTAVITDAVAASFGVPATTKGLSSVSREKLTTSVPTAVRTLLAVPGPWLSIREGITAYVPVIGDDIVPVLPWKSELGKDITVIFGYNRDEYALFATLMGDPTEDPAQRLAQNQKVLGITDDEIAAYRAANPEIDDRALWIQLCSDFLFRQPTLWSAANHPGRTYVYQLDWTAPATAGFLGACHGLDLPLTFDNTTSPMAFGILGGERPSGFEKISDSIITTWTSFAYDGDAGWPQFDEETATTRIWNDEVREADDPIAVSRRIWSTRA
jgi:para-nitrobenzyl esterase